MAAGSFGRVLFLAVGLGLAAQDTPTTNRVPWLAVFPEPMADGRNGLALEACSQFLRPDHERDAQRRSFARLDGEEWQLTGDVAMDIGPGRLSFRLRLAYRSGGIADGPIEAFHSAFNLPHGGRDQVPKNRLYYHLERDGAVVGDLQKPRLQMMDTDLAYTFEGGDARTGWRLGAALQLPTGKREDFSGSGGLDGLVGGAAWKQFGKWRIHGQAERVFIGLPKDSPYRAVLSHRALSRVWAGLGIQGQGRGLKGLGVDLSLAYAESPYRLGLSRIDRPGWQQHWTITHRAHPRWFLVFSEEAGTYMAPDVMLALGYRFP